MAERTRNHIRTNVIGHPKLEAERRRRHEQERRLDRLEARLAALEDR